MLEQAKTALLTQIERLAIGNTDRASVKAFAETYAILVNAECASMMTKWQTHCDCPTCTDGGLDADVLA